jgi:hypothetical protein
VTDRLTGLPDRDLGIALATVGRDLAFPEVPDLSTVVLRRLEEEPPHTAAARLVPLSLRGWLRSPARRAALALAAVLLLASGAVAGSLLVRGVRILIAPDGQETPPRVGPSPTGPLGKTLFLGDEATFEQAKARVDFRVLTPTVPGLPEPVVYVDDDPPGGRVSLVYPASPALPETEETGVGMLVMEFVGHVEKPFIEKLVHQNIQVLEIEVDGNPGYWVEGDHTLTYLDEHGEFLDESTRVAGNTLLWQRGDLTFRLESALSMEEAIRIAESVR